MRRKATTVFAALLILWGLWNALVPSHGWTFYTPYSSVYMDSGSILESETASHLAGAPNVSAWTLLLIGCVLMTLMQAPKRIAIGALVAYGLAASVHLAPATFMAIEHPRRYHYYYVQSGSEAGATAYGWVSLLLLATGFLLSVVPALVQRYSKPSNVV